MTDREKIEAIEKEVVGLDDAMMTQVEFNIRAIIEGKSSHTPECCIANSIALSELQ